jgi:hypothetical protein
MTHAMVLLVPGLPVDLGAGRSSSLIGLAIVSINTSKGPRNNTTGIISLNPQLLTWGRAILRSKSLRVPQEADTRSQ